MEQHPKNWKYSSPAKKGFYTVISPGNSSCKDIWIFRLNLKKGEEYVLFYEDLELNGVVIEGKVSLDYKTKMTELAARDSFYLPGKRRLKIIALEDSFLFIAGGRFEGTGNYFTRMFDLSLALGDIHQIHGEEPFRRDVFMTLAQQDKASRLICGISVGDPGKWTSWPPHEHSKDLEEVYCYFDIPKPKFALHLASRKPGVVEAVHPVSTGDCVIIPEGYHPTCAIPGVRSCYFWAMAARSAKSRRYDLSINDPNFV